MTNPIPMFKEEPAEIWERDAARHSLDELFVLARQYKSGKEYRNLLNFISRFQSLVNWKPSRCAFWYVSGLVLKTLPRNIFQLM